MVAKISGPIKTEFKLICQANIEPQKMWAQMVPKVYGPTNSGPKNASQYALEVNQFDQWLKVNDQGEC